MEENDLKAGKNPVPERIRLFPGTAPGSEGVELEMKEEFEKQADGTWKHIVRDVLEPEMTAFIPSDRKDPCPAVVIIPGGAFRRLVYNREGEDIARWLNSLGIVAFVLKLRLPVNDHRRPEDVSLIDVQRAVRLLRHYGKQWGILPDQIGVMGFSAGGFMAALLAAAFDRQVYPSQDEADGESARPDFCVCGYPAISIAAQLEAEKRKSRDTRLSEKQIRLMAKYNIEEMVNPQTPPLFIMETDDDRTTLAENSISLYMAARKAGVPAELHIFRTGGHGYGLGNDKGQTGQWRSLFAEWMRSLGILK